MKKYLLSAAATLLLSTGAQAATTYVLNNITYDNTFGTAPVICDGCGTGTAVDDGAGNITLTGLAWSFNSGGSQYSAMINGNTTLAPTYTPVTSPANALPAGSEILNNTGFCTTVTFASTDPCSTTGFRSSYGMTSFRTGLTSAAVPASSASRRPARATDHPRLSSARDTARPIPVPAPVTIATLAIALSLRRQ